MKIHTVFGSISLLLSIFSAVNAADSQIITTELGTVVQKMPVSIFGEGFSDIGSANSVAFTNQSFLYKNLRFGGKLFFFDGAGLSISGGGVLLDYLFGQRFYIAPGIFTGGASVMVTQLNTDSVTNLNSIVFYDGGGLFWAPRLVMGVRFGKTSISVVGEYYQYYKGAEPVQEFKHTFAGLSIGTSF